MNREYYIKKLESLEEIEDYAKNVEQNLLCNELIAFLNSEMTTDEDIIRESRSDTKKGLLLRALLNKGDLAIIKAWEDAEEMPEALKAIIGKNIKRIDRNRINEMAKKLIASVKRPLIIEVIDKIKNSVFITGEDIEVIYNSVLSSKKFSTKDIEALLILVDGINKGQTIEVKPVKTANNKVSDENDSNLQNEIKTKLKELFERCGFTWEIYPDGKKWYILTENDEIVERIKKHYDNSKNKKEFIKVSTIADGIKCRYEEYLDYIAKHGNIENIEKMLTYLNSKGLLSKLCYNGEILAKTMVLTKTDEIEQLLEIIKEHTEEKSEEAAKDVLLKSPTLLFKSTPSIGSKQVKIGPGRKSPTNISGSMTTFQETIKLLDERGIKIDLSKRGVIFVGISTQKVKRNIDILTLYNMPLGEEDAISSLGSTNPGKLIDLAIESEAYDYIRWNLSRTVSNDFSNTMARRGSIPNAALPYVLKFYKERINQEAYKTLWDTPKKRLDNQALALACPFRSIEEIFEKYGKVKVKLESGLEETFDEIINIEENTRLYDYTDDDYIRDFDKQFKCDDNDLAYKFGNVIISRYKFLRYYNTLINKYYRDNAEEIMAVYEEKGIKKDILLYALTKDSMLDENELGTIVKCIENFELERTKAKQNR